MLSWIRNKLAKPVYVDCYTKNSNALVAAKLKPALKFIPAWWRDLPPTMEAPILEGVNHARYPVPTMRSCAGFMDLYKKSFCVPAPCDIQIYVGPEGSDEYYWRYSENDYALKAHPQFQMGGFMQQGTHQQLQLGSPWGLRCEEEINFLIFDPFWHDGDDPYRTLVPPGVVNFKYQSGLNCNIFVKRHPTEGRHVLIKYGSPLAFILPLTERKVVFRYSFMKPEDEAKLFHPRAKFSRAYEFVRRNIKHEEATCPMKSK